jgi:IS1 family transposase
MNKLTTDKQSAIVRCLCEGNSIRGTARLTGTSKDTVQKLLRDLGAHCKNYHDRFVTSVTATRVQSDEIWGFVGKKERLVAKADKGQGVGDVWTWTALDPDSKLMIAYRVGNRDARNAVLFIQDLADRLANRIELTTDGLNHYRPAVEAAFGWNGADYAMLIKIFGPTPEGSMAARRYSPPACVGIEKRWIMGAPIAENVTTSHVERQNRTIRMQNRRMTRLTDAFSKKVEYHLYSVALHFMWYNYCQPHGTLTKAAGGIKRTPAMAAGLTDRVWKAEDLLALMDA